MLHSEAVLQSELHGSRTVCVYRVQERVPGQATRGSRRIVWSSEATYRIAAGVAEVGIVDAKRRVVQQVEGLGVLRHRKQKPAPGTRPSMGNRFCRAE
jgi:hypothetical protein